MQNPGDAGMYMVGPGGVAPPEITDITAYAAFLGEPVLIVVPRFTATLIDGDGSLLATDAFDRAVHRAGGHQLDPMGLAYLQDPAPAAPGWTTTLDPDAATARVTGPGQLGDLYDGTFDAQADWRAQVTDNRDRGLVVITGTCAPDDEAVLEMIASGRARWIRTTLRTVGRHRA